MIICTKCGNLSPQTASIQFFYSWFREAPTYQLCDNCAKKLEDWIRNNAANPIIDELMKTISEADYSGDPNVWAICKGFCAARGWFIGETTSAFEVRDEKTNELICIVHRTKAK